MTLPSVLALLTLFVGVPLNLYVTIKLRRLAAATNSIAVLRERALTAVVVTLTVIVFGLIFVQNDQLPPPLDLAATKVITRGVVLVLAIVPALYWIRLYRRAGIWGNEPEKPV